jgi:hypothetical protein
MHEETTDSPKNLDLALLNCLNLSSAVNIPCFLDDSSHIQNELHFLISILVGQYEYESEISKTKEYAPVAASLIGAKGMMKTQALLLP